MKKTAILIVVGLIIVSLFVGYSQPSIEETQKLQLNYENYQNSIDDFPTDKETLLNMYETSKYIFDNDVFYKAFDKTSYLNEYKEMKENSYYVIKPKKYFQHEIYCESIYFHLKLLLALERCDEYSDFFSPKLSLLFR